MEFLKAHKETRYLAAALFEYMDAGGEVIFERAGAVLTIRLGAPALLDELLADEMARHGFERPQMQRAVS